MVGVLALLFFAVPIAELYVLIQVGQAIGALETVALLVVVSVLGAALVKQQGLAVWRRAQRQMDAGHVPSSELIDGVLVLAAGALLLTPGFLTDVVGLLLVFPPTRAGLRAWARRRIRTRVQRSAW